MMTIIAKTLILLLLCFSFKSFALDFRPGDIILIEQRCYSCSIIADETGSRFSHSAVIMGSINNEIHVAQAFGPVHITTLHKFLNQKTKGTTALIRRAYDLKVSTNDLLQEFQQNWKGIPFDAQYRWDDKKLYCSEFVAKFLEVFLGPVLPPKPLDFSRNWGYWTRRFNSVPQGEPGNSPADLERSLIFYDVGEID